MRCAQGHAHDVARQGYLNLLPGGARAGTADTAAMVDARARFLATGRYAPLTEALAAAVPAGAGAVVDVGAGTGHHTARVLEAVGGTGVALDLSKHAARRAARAHPRLASVVADAWAPLPLADGTARAVLTVFAPRAAEEAARVLAPGGRLVVAVPTGWHLRALVDGLGLVTVDPRKQERLEARLAGWTRVQDVLVERPLALTADEVALIVAMGPSSRHAPAAPTGPATTALSVRVSTWAPPG